MPTQGKKKQNANKADQQRSTSSTVEITLYQDSTSLQSTEGDTGSVVWRSSLRLGTSLCRQIHKPLYGQPALLNASALQQQTGTQPTTTTVLELGSGTGILPLTLLSALPATATATAAEQGLRWIATDQEAMLHLLRKNVDLLRDPRLEPAPLDWCEVSQRSRNKSTYAGGVDGLRRNTMEWRGARQEERGSDAKTDGWPDLIIAVDCVFNPSLFTPLVDTLDAFTLPNHTVTLVVIELRSDEATLAFLETWLGSDERWRIWAVPAEQMSCGLDRGYAAWVAWKEQ
ncbi:unnamed protein product [Jaminaea pallidilutea]